MLPRRKSQNPSGQSSSFSAFLSSSRIAPDGNIYTEATASAVRPRWATHSATALSFSDVVARTEDRDPDWRLGIGSLGWYARKLINERLLDISPEVLRRVPWDPFGKIIWLDAVSTNRDTFYLWSVFCSVYPEAFTRINDSYRTYYVEDRMAPRLSVLTSTLSAIPFTGLYYLDLRKISTFTTHDLLSLPSAFPNLHTLLLDGKDKGSEISDSVVRGWSITRSFKKLEFVRLENCEFVTWRALEDLAGLPRLMVLEIPRQDDGPVNLVLKEGGWTRRLASGGGTPDEPEEGIAVKIAIGKPVRDIYRRTGGAKMLERYERSLETAHAISIARQRAADMEELDRRRKLKQKRLEEEQGRRSAISNTKKRDMGTLLDDFMRPPPPAKKRSHQR